MAIKIIRQPDSCCLLVSVISTVNLQMGTTNENAQTDQVRSFTPFKKLRDLIRLISCQLTLANARTGKVPVPLIFGGTALNR